MVKVPPSSECYRLFEIRPGQANQLKMLSRVAQGGGGGKKREGKKREDSGREKEVIRRILCDTTSPKQA